MQRLQGKAINNTLGARTVPLKWLYLLELPWKSNQAFLSHLCSQAHSGSFATGLHWATLWAVVPGRWHPWLAVAPGWQTMPGFLNPRERPQTPGVNKGIRIPRSSSPSLSNETQHNAGLIFNESSEPLTRAINPHFCAESKSKCKSRSLTATTARFHIWSMFSPRNKLLLFRKKPYL